ncbi:hypothetical protein V2J09_022478 [Rumex salicifolius]
MANALNIFITASIFLIITLPPSVSSSNHSDSFDYEIQSSGFDYSEALSKAILFFEGQRSGKLPRSQRAKWRANSALSDGKPENVKLVGGYYDAGDNVKFVWPMAYSVSLLGWAAIEYEKAVTSARQMGYLREAIRWGSDFISRAHTSPTTLYTQVGDGNSDHQCWERPEDMDTQRSLYKITSSSPGSEAAADASAALAASSIVFKGVDNKYSSKLLTKAKTDELIWAAAWLYKATGTSKYLNYVTSNQGWSSVVSEFSWDNKHAGAQTLLSKVDCSFMSYEFFAGKKSLSKYKSDAESFMCALLPGSTMLLLVYAKTLSAAHVAGLQCGYMKFSPSQINAFAKSQVDYILGKNPMKMSYMVGYGNNYPQQLHHRGASIPSITAYPSKIGCNQGYSGWFSSNKPNPNVHVGSIVGGPNSNDQFNDVRSDHAHLEPTTYMNAAFVGSVAAFVSNGWEVQLGSSINYEVPINMTVEAI